MMDVDESSERRLLLEYRRNWRRNGFVDPECLLHQLGALSVEDLGGNEDAFTDQFRGVDRLCFQRCNYLVGSGVGRWCPDSMRDWDYVRRDEIDKLVYRVVPLLLEHNPKWEIGIGYLDRHGTAHMFVGLVRGNRDGMQAFVQRLADGRVTGISLGTGVRYRAGEPRVNREYLSEISLVEEPRRAGTSVPIVQLRALQNWMRNDEVYKWFLQNAGVMCHATHAEGQTAVSAILDTTPTLTEIQFLSKYSLETMSDGGSNATGGSNTPAATTNSNSNNNTNVEETSEPECVPATEASPAEVLGEKEPERVNGVDTPADADLVRAIHTMLDQITDNPANMLAAKVNGMPVSQVVTEEQYKWFENIGRNWPHFKNLLERAEDKVRQICEEMNPRLDQLRQLQDERPTAETIIEAVENFMKEGARNPMDIDARAQRLNRSIDSFLSENQTIVAAHNSANVTDHRRHKDMIHRMDGRIPQMSAAAPVAQTTANQAQKTAKQTGVSITFDRDISRVLAETSSRMFPGSAVQAGQMQQQQQQQPVQQQPVQQQQPQQQPVQQQPVQQQQPMQQQPGQLIDARHSATGGSAAQEQQSDLHSYNPYTQMSIEMGDSINTDALSKDPMYAPTGFAVQRAGAIGFEAPGASQSFRDIQF